MKPRLGLLIFLVPAVWMPFAQSKAAEVETTCFFQLSQRFADVVEIEKIVTTSDEQDEFAKIISLLCNEEIENQELDKLLTEFIAKKSNVSAKLGDLKKSEKTLSTSPLALLLLMEVLSVGVNQENR